MVKAKIVFGDSRSMQEVENESVDLIVTSPPYWHLKDYEVTGQIGFGQSLHEYLKSLYQVWRECYRILKPGTRLCINVGDQFARAVVYGRYKVIPIHAEVISQCEEIGFDYMGSIIWQKKTTMNTTGGATVMGSFPYPPNGIIEIDYEFILIFKKPGKRTDIDKNLKEASKLTKEEWKEYFAGHWNFGGAKKIGHEAMFPDELPKRLIKMFTFIGDTVLDPFLGSGTTAKVALELGRNVIGYEINKNYLKIIKNKIGISQNIFLNGVEIIERSQPLQSTTESLDYVPKIQDAKPLINPGMLKFSGERLYKVEGITDDLSLILDNGLVASFLGVKIVKKKEALDYLKNYILGKNIFIKYDDIQILKKDRIMGYIYLKNKIFVNSYLIKAGYAVPSDETEYKYKSKFIKIFEENSHVSHK